MAAPPAGVTQEPAAATASPAGALLLLFEDLVRQYLPAVSPLFDRMKDKYQNLKANDERIFWLGHGILALLVVYIFLSPIFFIVRAVVLVFVLYSTWFVINGSDFAQNESTKRFAVAAYALLLTYLVKMLL